MTSKTDSPPEDPATDLQGLPQPDESTLLEIQSDLEHAIQ